MHFSALEDFSGDIMSPKIITWIDTMPFVFLVGTCAAIGVGIAPYYLRNRNKSRKRGVGSPHPSSCVKEYSNVIYLDYNATTPIWEEVRDAMLPYTCERFGNPSSLHVYGESSAKCVRDARANIRSLIGACNNHNIVFTSCGTESDNRAIDIALSAARHSRKTSQGKLKYYTPHVVTCSIEHPAVLVYLQHLAYTGEIQLSIVPVDGAGVVSADDVESALSDDTAMVTIMHSNNEVGVLQPIEDIARRVHARKGQYIFVHTDAAQSLGKVPVNVRSLDVDLLTIVGHKFGAPKGVAALYINDRLSSTLDGGVKPLLHGGGQESGWRAGTENTLLLAGLGEAARLAAVELTVSRPPLHYDVYRACPSCACSPTSLSSFSPSLSLSWMCTPA